MRIRVDVKNVDGTFVASRDFSNFQQVVAYLNRAYYPIVKHGQVYEIFSVNDDGQKSLDNVVKGG